MEFPSANGVLNNNSEEEETFSDSDMEESSYPCNNWSGKIRASNRSSRARVRRTPTPDEVRNRRGRPKTDAITSLILKGSSSPSSIKCDMCFRVFPRLKSLQAHLRTHTGERPYICDYPNCGRAFAQSGQLKTHQRLHTGEKPFFCSIKGCEKRFTHSNRHCPEHPSASLERDTRSDQNRSKKDIENRNENASRQERHRSMSERSGLRSAKSKPQSQVVVTDSERSNSKTMRSPGQEMKYNIALALLQLSKPFFFRTDGNAEAVSDNPT